MVEQQKTHENFQQPAAAARDQKKKLLERAYDALRDAGLDQQVAEQRVAWMRGYILFHNKRHPDEMAMTEIQEYLTSEVFERPQGGQYRVEAENSLRFLYESVLGRYWPGKEVNGSEGDNKTGRGADKAVGKASYLNGRDCGVKLVDRMRNALRVGQFALDSEKIYLNWTRRYLRFHGGRDAEEMGGKHVEQFLTHLAVDREVAAKTQKQALCALVFLYETVLGRPLGQLMPIRGRQGGRIPVVMTQREVPIVLDEVVGADGLFGLMCELMYGSGSRIKESCRVRVKDAELERRQLEIRGGKGDHDRFTVLPERLIEPLRRQIERVRRLHEQDLAQGYGAVWMPPSLRRKWPNAERELGWQYLFPSKRLSIDPRDRAAGKRRHHIHVTSLEKAIKAAVMRTGLTKRITAHTFRHSFATHLLETGHNIKQVQELMGHKDIRTTMIYLHAMEGGTTNVRSPLDSLLRE